jgi:hypothetical protein
MTGPGIQIEFSHVFDDACSQGIKMNITGEFQKIGVVLADDGLVAVLKKMTISFVSSVKVDHKTCEQFPHA